MQKKSNLFLCPQQYSASVDWENFSVVTADVRQGEMDEHGVLTMPPATRLPYDLVSHFVQLRNYEDKAFKKRLSSFVAAYGKLGITGRPAFSYDPPLYGQSNAEYIDWWVDYAEDVNRLLQLYSAIKRARAAHEPEDDVPDILNKVIVFKKEMRVISSFWAETGEQTGFMKDMKGINIAEMTISDMIEGACYILAGSISRGLAGGISLGMGGIKPSKKFPIGYVIIEERYTHYPLAAVYNELWETVRADEPVEVCLYSRCGELFSPDRSTRKFCSDRCRVAHHRKIKELSD
jgi:hypothetical protein